MPGHYDDKKKKKKSGMPNHVGLVEKLGKRAGKTGTGTVSYTHLTLPTSDQV